MQRPPKAVITNWGKSPVPKKITPERLRRLPPQRIIAILPINNNLTTLMDELKQTWINSEMLSRKLEAFLRENPPAYLNNKYNHRLLVDRLMDMMFDNPKSTPWDDI